MRHTGTIWGLGVARQISCVEALALDHPHIDPDELATAIVEQVRSGDLDFRTRLLIRDNINGLQKYWGPTHLEQWLESCPVQETITAIWREDLGRVGFKFLGDQLAKITKPEEEPQPT